MAEILEDFEFRSAGYSKYPWDLWLDGQIWKLVRGKDYDCASNSMRAGAHLAAQTRNMKVRTNVTIDGDAIVIQAKGEV